MANATADTNAIKVLSEKGFIVDVFLYDVSEEIDNLNEYLEDENKDVNILKFGNQSCKPGWNETSSKRQPDKKILAEKTAGDFRSNKAYNRLYSALSKLKGKIWTIFCINDLDILPKSIYEPVIQYMDGRSYKAFIGIERYGLAWAGYAARRQGVPLVYWSYELYTHDHPRFKDFQRIYSIKKG